MAPFLCALCSTSNYVEMQMAAVFEQLQSVMWLWLGLAAVIALLSSFLRSSTFKGWLGEYKVKRWLAKALDAQHYHCAHNVTLQLADGSTTQIDHVVVSPYGIFVLETKHMQGWIFGSEKQPTWTQTIFKHRSSFQNPLRQNWRHIKALEEVLQVPLLHLHSVVVFTGDCSFKSVMPANVTIGRCCIDWIQSQTDVVLELDEVVRLRDVLSQKRLQATRSTHKAHVAQLQERHGQPREKVMPRKVTVVRKEPQGTLRPALAPVSMPPVATPTAALDACPECGKDLVRRSLPDAEGTPRYFVRCAHFPHCRFLQAEEIAAAAV